MNLAIIGAGESSRIKAEGLNMPKHLIKIGGEYLIERIIRVAREKGINRVFCIINEQEPELKEYLTSTEFGIPVNVTVKNTESSMHSLFALAPYLKNERFCLATTDTVFDEKEFADFLEYANQQDEAAGVLAVTRYIDDEKPLCIAMDESDRITKFSDKKEGYSWATGGLYIFSEIIFEEMDAALRKKISRLRNFLKMIVAQGYLIKGFAFSKMIDVDHVSDISKAEKFLNDLKK